MFPLCCSTVLMNSVALEDIHSRHLDIEHLTHNNLDWWLAQNMSSVMAALWSRCLV